MKYCTKCGHEMIDEAVVCVQCGCAAGGLIQPKDNSGTKTAIKVFMALAIAVFVLYAIMFMGFGVLMRTAIEFAEQDLTNPVEPENIREAKIIAIVYILIGVFCLLPLAWTIPMTVSAFKKINNGEKIGNGFKVCTMLFVNLIAGIILLCCNDI